MFPLMQLQRRGILLVVSGPSGVGKGTLIKGVLAKYPQTRLSVSCTTRPPRPGEREGVDYFFLSPGEFERRRDGGALLEWAEVYPGLNYGTPRGPVEEALAQGEDIILEIDDQGARQVRRLMGERAVLVFVAPPSFAELCRRLAGRKTESAEQLRARLTAERAKIADMGAYDYVIVNDQVAPATERLEAVLLAQQVAHAVVDWQSLRAALLAEADSALTGAAGEVRADG
jgi:guanylate kinase